MAKFNGYIGYVTTKETVPGVWEEVVTEKHHCGNFSGLSRREVASDTLNGKVTLNSKVSVVVSPYILDNYQYIAYVKIRNVKWQVTNIEIQYPELILTLGGVYNDEN